jgi:hypothetical protein
MYLLRCYIIHSPKLIYVISVVIAIFRLAKCSKYRGLYLKPFISILFEETFLKKIMVQKIDIKLYLHGSELYSTSKIECTTAQIQNFIEISLLYE